MLHIQVKKDRGNRHVGIFCNWNNNFIFDMV